MIFVVTCVLSWQVSVICMHEKLSIGMWNQTTSFTAMKGDRVCSLILVLRRYKWLNSLFILIILTNMVEREINWEASTLQITKATTILYTTPTTTTTSDTFRFDSIYKLYQRQLTQQQQGEYTTTTNNKRWRCQRSRLYQIWPKVRNLSFVACIGWIIYLAF